MTNAYYQYVSILIKKLDFTNLEILKYFNEDLNLNKVYFLIVNYVIP